MFLFDAKTAATVVLLDTPRGVTDSSGNQVADRESGQQLAYYLLLLVPIGGGAPVTVEAKGPVPKNEITPGIVKVSGLEARPYEVRRSGQVERTGVTYRVQAVTPLTAG